VRVELLSERPLNAKVSGKHAYDAQVTLFIEEADGSTTPSGWSTRKEGGGDGRPFSFTPGQGLIEGWTEGVLKMREGERAKIHVPSEKGYGGAPQGQKGGGWYIPASALLPRKKIVLRRF
jgi:FKBP-type peptidyl-prolyl cis-trans isomerase 2